jgi:hypothetical protein
MWDSAERTELGGRLAIFAIRALLNLPLSRSTRSKVYPSANKLFVLNMSDKVC